ncbi:MULTISPECIES: hypothetical protein [unclassified Acinetobacter]|uniref:hypothetical protein n=1 Tax=unclassified Acinetobacter TaxID=196816 RepID=UPI0021B815CB|nr:MULTISPECIES: hypothetical protein [unclassified Acinetobacter]MCT8090482.1 hypothetical protein [Acinetobacter sp. F_3_1]MCT8098887.1 hypothetical protein [Acinetobacter sp. C_3_1]MCT8102045.1 hypothetical protein [Acinetobacter sp. C_4_1]MCT8135855.1 hypothetical protein [Acinetobacter sp. T_3_1]
MPPLTFKDIHIQFCKKIDELQIYNNFTVSLSFKKLAIEDCIYFIKYIKNMKYQAIKRSHSYEADQLFHMQCLLNSLLSSLKIWIFLEEKDYKKAWDSLIDAQEYLIVAKKINHYDGLINLEKHLESIEKSIFPQRKIYLSAAFTSSIGYCSICNREFFECDHVENNIYCGQLCLRIKVENIKANHVALVENPADRRCIVTSYGKDKSVIDSFTLENIEDKDEVQDGIFHGYVLSFKKLDWH